MTEVITSLGAFLERYGFPLTALGVIVFIIIKYFIPIITKQFEQQQTYLYKEIERLHTEARDRNDKMLQAFQQNTQAFNELRTTMDKISQNVEKLQDDMAHVKEDMRDVYTIVGEKRNLFSRGKDDTR